MNLKFKQFLFSSFVLVLLSSGCSDSSWVEENTKNLLLKEDPQIVLLANDMLLYLVGDELLRYNIITGDIKNILNFENTKIQFKVTSDPSQISFYEDALSEPKLTILSYNESMGGITLNEEVHSREELIDSYWSLESYNHSGDKLALLEMGGISSHLLIKDVLGGIEGLVDYADTFLKIIWSPNDRFLAYITSGPSGGSGLAIFDTVNDKFGIGVYDEQLDYYFFTTYSTSVSDKIMGMKNLKLSDLRTDIITWFNENTILFKTIEQLYITTFWTYNADTDILTRIASINASDDWLIKDASISKDLSTISYIKEFKDSDGSDDDESNNKQELWVSNADGTDSKLIYKNY